MRTVIAHQDRWHKVVATAVVVIVLAACQGGDTGVASTGPDRTTLGIPEGQWPTYGGGPYNQNFSPLVQIDKNNVADLSVAWVFNYGTGEHDLGDLGLDYRFEVTPLLVGGVMYLSTPSSPNAPGVPSTITALVPETGAVLWRYASPYNIHGRGIAYWPGDEQTAPRIFFATDGGLILAIDATTGEPAADFGLQGRIDAYIGVVSEVVGNSRRSTYTIPNPVTIYKDLVITGARPGEAGPPGPRGDIRAFSARTGRLQWTFHTLPRPGEPNASELQPAGVPDLTGANVWSTMTLDPENGLLYATTGDINGPRRGTPVDGPEPFANTLLALLADTGELAWYRKITIKDLWDWDLPTPTVLFDLDIDGNTVPAILLTGKQGLVFMFNRLTGESLNGYELRQVPGTDVPDLDYWPVQPFPAAPEPVARTTMRRDEIPDLVPGMKENCEMLWDRYDPINPGLYGLPQTDRAIIRVPGSTGGPNWGGGSYNPNLGYYFINVQEGVRIQGPVRSGNERDRTSFDFTMPDGTTLSCGALPWGALVAVDVRNQKIAWKAPLGVTPKLGAAGMQTGARNLGGNISTASGLVFIAASNDAHFRAYDGQTGTVLWDTILPAGGHATPVSYMGADGKQYVVIAAGGGTSVGRADAPHMSDSLVAFRLP
ncbi:MAG: PQQ-binding-like beta-propeller repeat protein [Gammaproteobacteria bacterium]|nr:PQQ-binding-like beta-propeller repeat protein [Gammaproteobacteria bacterium]MDH5303532.1 PQQ-binding-like beta-propeller repeat protein [Gammaproteobacteria bacterium]MDH5321874.1 PQQ-binding-like beta-propeller repeat protein [Gammaproteobacteria bacterium]